MPFDPSSLLTLKHDRKSVVVPRNHCSSYDGTIAVAQRNFRSLRSIAQDGLVLEASIPDYNHMREIEVSKEAWPLVREVVQSVTITPQSDKGSMYREFLESAYYKSLDDEGTEGNGEEGTGEEQGSAIDQETECVTAHSTLSGDAESES